MWETYTVPFLSSAPPTTGRPTKNLTEQLLAFKRYRQRSPSRKEMETERERRRERIREQRARAREAIASISRDPESDLRRMTREQIDRAADQVVEEERPVLRRASWISSGSSWGENSFADTSGDYDKWQQAYRLIGYYIDCDHQKDVDDHKSHDDENGDEESSDACSRWAIWASYIDPGYQGKGYYEYFGDGAEGTLDCHNPESEWQLLGIYRQDLYQFIEQISKHLWAIDEYEYAVALAGLAYITKYECFYTGLQDSNGYYLKASVAPKQYGNIQMALYSDDHCITPDTSSGYTYDDAGYQTGVRLEGGSHDENDDQNDDDAYAYAEDWWYDTQEYTLTQLNEVYETFKYCTSCVDYPTYQDGYFIGDYGTDDDDLINQCWKFHSHDSYTCGADCLSKGSAQGTILSVEYGGQTFGEVLEEFYTFTSNGGEEDGNAVSSKHAGESRWSRLLANAFVTFAFIIFIATFLAFAVARRSRHRERASGRSRRLLDDEDQSRRRRSRSQKPDGDGVFRNKSSDGRSKSGASRKSTRSRSRRSSSRAYDAPSTRSSSKAKRSSSRKSTRSRRDRDGDGGGGTSTGGSNAGGGGGSGNGGATKTTSGDRDNDEF